MPKKKIIIIVLIFLSVLYLVASNMNKLPPKEERNILGYPEQHNRGASQGNLEGLISGDKRYYFEYKGFLYYHQPQSMSISGHTSPTRDLKINNGDPETFTIIDSNFAKDKNQVYYWGSVVEKADPETFQTLDWPRAKDKNYFFSGYKITREVEK